MQTTKEGKKTAVRKPLEKALLDRSRTPREVSELFSDAAVKKTCDAYDEKLHIQLMRSLAFGARHQPVPPIPAPPPPAVIGVTAQGAVTFRGSLGAREYTICVSTIW